jgi:hypothetical protein
MMLAVAKCRHMAILRLAIGPALTGPSFYAGTIGNMGRVSCTRI